MPHDPTLYFEDVTIGVTLRSEPHRVTAGDILAFGHLTRDETPLHTDPDYARTTHFGGCIAHGLFGLSLIEGLKSRAGLFNRSAVASLSWDKVHFRRPIYPGDEVHVRWSFLKATDQPGEHQGFVVEETHLLNQRDQITISANHMFIVRRRPTEKSGPVKPAGEP